MSESLVDHIIHQTPFWLLALLVFAGMALAAWAGVWLRRRVPDVPGEKEDPKEGLVVTSVMGLLALLIGFTFSLAIDRFDTRRERVLMEANAIQTAYLQAQLLDEPHRTGISHLLVGYTDLSIALSQAQPGPEQNRLLQQNGQQALALWSATKAAFPSIKPYDFSSTFVQSMTNVLELNAARQQARRARVPSEIFAILYLYQFIAAGVIGYALIGRGGWRTGSLLLFLFGLSLVLVIDVDYPTGGGINVSQEPMLTLKAALGRWPPDVFGR